MHKIYIVDDEMVFCTAVSEVLTILGYEVRVFYDATRAYNFFVSDSFVTSESIVLLDVTLSGGSDDERFGESQTKNFAITGKVLAETLLEKGIFPEGLARRLVLYTANYTSGIWPDLEVFSQNRRVRLWRKRAIPKLDEIVSLVQEV